MEYKEMIKLRALQLELENQLKLASKRIEKYLISGKPLDNIQYQVLYEIKNFYENSYEDINQKFNVLNK